MSVVALFPDEPRPLSIEQEFEIWYERYPRKESRGRAIKAFPVARRKASLEQLMEGLGRYIDHVSGKERQWIALPATWLNDERWLDEPERISTSDPNYARLRAWETRGVWLPHWGKPPPRKS